MKPPCLLDAVVGVLPSAVEVLFLADRGFADVELFKHLQRLNWHYRIRIKSSFTIDRGKHGVPTSSYHLHTSQALFLHHVRVTKARYGLVHVALAHHYPSQERWYVVSDQPTTTDTFVEYGLRFDIEDRQNLSAYLRLIGLSAIAENPGIATQSS